MKKWLTLSIVLMTTSLLNGCSLDNGSPADPPTGMKATAGEGRVKIEWTASSGVEYWLFSATDAALSAFGWTSLPNAQVAINAQSPYYQCGLQNGIPYYFAVNGRVNGGPGGASSLQVNATPYDASGNWATPVAIPSATNLYGVGYTSLTTCSNITTSASGGYATVGAGGEIYTSADNGQSWIPRTSTVSTDLYAIAGYAANQNNATTPGLLWIAVGAGGVSVYSKDQGATWQPGRGATTPANPSLNAITQVAGTFFAVGDAGTILSTIDGTNWVVHTPATSVTTNNLRGIAYGTSYVAVGDNGTILTSTDGNTWTARTLTPALTSNLKQVATAGNLIVAVGDGGTIVTSKDGGATWVWQTLAGAPNLISVTAEFQIKANDVIDGWLGIVPNVQFVAVDNNGNAYVTKSNATITNDLTWATTAISTGATSLNALVSSGFGYVAVGNAGATVSAF